MSGISKRVSGSWVSGDYGIMKTATDTFSTLPAVLYPNDTIATVELKGNAVQSGTPAPSNPIIPQGTADLETVGTKAGQYKISISSGSTTTPIYLGEVETTRQIKKLVLTGEENLNYSAESYGYCYTLINSTTFPINNSFCSHFKNCGYTGSSRSTGRESLGNEEFICVRTSTNIYFRYDSVSDANEFKAYLQQQYAAGTPVTIWYVLASEETGIVNEPLMRIDDYADTVSNVSIPVTAGGDTISVDTTVRPSGVTVNYKGWHTGAVHERDSGQWN